MSLEIKLSKVQEILKNKDILVENNNFVDKEASYISFDSRSIKENTLFFCKGQHYKKKYLISAIQSGAITYVYAAPCGT